MATEEGPRSDMKRKINTVTAPGSIKFLFICYVAVSARLVRPAKCSVIHAERKVVTADKGVTLVRTSIQNLQEHLSKTKQSWILPDPFIV